MIHRPGGYPGFHSHVSFMPERGIGVVVLTNEARTGSLLADFVARAIYDTLLEKPNLPERREKLLAEAKQAAAGARQRIGEDRERRAARPQKLAHPLAAFAGTYFNPALGCMEWAVEGEKLRARIGVGESGSEVYDGEKDQLRVELTGSGEVVAFSFRDREAVSLTYDGQVFVKKACARLPGTPRPRPSSPRPARPDR